MDTNKKILVTGGTGFLASHTLLLAVRAGHDVRTTVRTLKRRYEVRQMLENGGASPEQAASVEVVAADLTRDAGWDEACAGRDYVLHMASPRTAARHPAPADFSPDREVQTAVDAALRVLRVAGRAGVRRVVLTGSLIAATRASGSTEAEPYTEADWPDVAPSKHLRRRLTPRSRAARHPKVAVERAAWKWYEAQAGGGVMGTELTVVNAGLILGPILGERGGRKGGSRDVVKRMFDAQGFALLSHMGTTGFVDVRDVAAVHLRAMTEGRAAGNRYLACASDGPMRWGNVADMLKEDLAERGLGEAAGKVSTERPSKAVLLLLVGLFDLGVLWEIVGGKHWALNYVSGKKAEADLDWRPRSTREATLACAESLIEFGLVPGVDARN